MDIFKKNAQAANQDKVGAVSPTGNKAVNTPSGAAGSAVPEKRNTGTSAPVNAEKPDKSSSASQDKRE